MQKKTKKEMCVCVCCVYSEDLEDPNILKSNDKVLNKMIEIILHFITQVSTYSVLSLFIVKMQFMNDLDWRITHAVCECIKEKNKKKRLKNVCLILSGWPQTQKSHSNRYTHTHSAAKYQQIRKQFKPIVIRLQPWNIPEVAEFLQAEFRVKSIHPSITDFVYNKTGLSVFFFYFWFFGVVFGFFVCFFCENTHTHTECIKFYLCLCVCSEMFVVSTLFVKLKHFWEKNNEKTQKKRLKNEK